MTSARILRTYLMVAGLYTLSASLIWGVNTLFLLAAGLDIFGVFVANAAFTAGMVIFEIPTGVLADTRGRRVSFLLSVVVLLVGTLGYVALSEIEAGLAAFVVVSVVLGLGFTFYSGAVEAWLVDALDATGFEGNLDEVFARGAGVSGAAMLVGTVGGGLLGDLDLAVPFLARAALLAGVLAVGLVAMRDVGFTPRTIRLSEVPAAMGRVARDSLAYGWQRRSVRLLMIGSFFQGGFLMWGFYAWQPYFLELLGRDAVWVAGVVAALISLSLIVGNSLVAWLTRFCGRRTTLLIWAAAVQAAAVVGVGLAGSFWLAVALLLVGTAAMGVMGPVKQAYLHQVIPSEQRATVVSFDSMVGSGGGVLGQGGLGYLSRAVSIPAGYVTGGVALVLVLPALRLLRRLAEPADVFEGRRAGIQGPCAAQGIPEVAAVDATPRQAV